MTWLQPRIDRMKKSFPAPGIDRPLMKAYPVEIAAIKAIAARTLTRSHGHDNVTPNGTVMPRKHILRHLDAFRLSVMGELDHIDSCLSHVADPILRVSRQWKPDRPYAVGKMHSDVWRGEPRNSLIALLPLWGTENCTVRFREPKWDTFRPLDDYSLGNTEGTDYDVPFEPGFVYYCDAFCLHQTVKLKEGERVSADLRGLFGERLPGEESPWLAASVFKPTLEGIY